MTYQNARADGVPPAIAEAIGDWSAEFKAMRDAHKAEIDGLRMQMTEIEQRSGSYSTMPGAAASGAGALASTLIKDDAWAGVANRKASRTSIDVTSSMLLNVQANTIKYDDGGLSVTENVGVREIVRRPRFVRERLITLPATGGSIEYSRESFTNAADVQGGGSPFEHEGVAKPESTIDFTLVEEKIPTIAHWVKASRQILADVAGLRNVIENRLRYGLELKLEQQILNGTGAGAQMSGLFKSGNYQAFTPTSGDTAIDSISRALGILHNSYEIMADLVILNPVDYRALQRLKATDSGLFLWGNPNGADSDQIWAVPIHASPSVTQGKFGITSTREVGELFMREDARVEVGYVNDDFTKNLVVLLGEMRGVFVVERPTSTLYGDLTA